MGASSWSSLAKTEPMSNTGSQLPETGLWPSPHRTKELGVLVPVRLPGATPDSSKKLAELLKENHEKYHMYFNDVGYHNHLTHHLFAAWFFGGDANLLDEAFEVHARYQRPAFQSPHPIERSNWRNFLKDEKYFQAYCRFFADEIAKLGVGPTLESYLFSKAANWPELDANEPEKAPRMLSRFFGGLFHPLIHTGHIEFGVPGMVMEGLAQAATTNTSCDAFLGPGDFLNQPPTMEATETALSTLTLDAVGDELAVDYEGPHSLSIIAEMLQDPRLAAGQACQRSPNNRFSDTLKSRGELIAEYGRKWVIRLDENHIRTKVEEISWLVTLLFGLGGWREGHKFRADFFLMHCVTSSLFVPPILAHLSLHSKVLLVRTYFLCILGYWVSRGRPQIPIRAYYRDVTTDPQPSSKLPRPIPSKEALSPDYDQNPWLRITQSVLHHPDEHLLKTIRALTHYSALYGDTAPGDVRPIRDGKRVSTGLDGDDLLDGTLFIRVAGEMMGALGWVREGEEIGTYDRRGLGWDEVWQK